MESKPHAGEVGTRHLAGVAVEQRVWVVHCAGLAGPFARGTLVHATKTTGGSAAEGWIGVLAHVANTAAQR